MFITIFFYVDPNSFYNTYFSILCFFPEEQAIELHCIWNPYIKCHQQICMESMGYCMKAIFPRTFPVRIEKGQNRLWLEARTLND